MSADLENTQSLVEGMRSVLGDKVDIVTHLGANLTDDPALQERSTMFGRTIPRDNRSSEAIIAEALEVSKNAEVIVAALGESSEMSGESSSRTDLNIPESQKRLLEALVKTGKPVVLVLFAGRPLTLTWEQEHVPAILNVWFGGTETGKAVADVLFGDVNPSGKLPATFPQNVGQLPMYYSEKNTGRPLAKSAWFQKFRSNYLDVSNEPLYPFGFGLSYTEFEYSPLKLEKATINKSDKLKITVQVKNKGQYNGEEVVQLYIQDLVASQTRPVKELKGFQKVWIEKGKSKTVEFEISEEDLKFYNQKLDFISEPGKFKVYIGTNSRDVQEAEFELID